MKLVREDYLGREVGAEMVTWGDHAPACRQCRAVDLSRTASYANVCAMGAKLLQEKIAADAAPQKSAKQKAVADWAQQTGAFTEFDAKTKQPPKYVGEGQQEGENAPEAR